MPLQVADLSAKLGLDTSVFDRGITGALGKFNPIGGAALGASAIAVGAVAAIGVAAFKMGAEFDDAYDSIRIGTGATGARLDGLKGSFKDVVTDVPASFGDAAAAITGLNQRLGVTGAPLRDLSDQFLELSKITGTNVADNVRLGTRLFGDWSIKTGQQADTLDQLFRATQKSGIGLSDLMSTVVQFGAPLRNMGFSFGDSVAMLAKWEKEGVNTSTVLTGMKFALKVFAKAGDEPQAALAGITTKIHDTTNAQAAMTLGMKTFGLRAGPDMVAAIREGRFQYQDFAKIISNGSDTIHTATKDTEDFAESWTKLTNTLKVKVEPAVSSVFNSISAALKDPFGAQAQGDVRGMMSAVETLTDNLPKQWGQAAVRTKTIIEDLNKLIEKPEVLGDIHAEHTRGQLKNIRDDIVKQLHISVQESDQIMATMFRDWNPKKTLDAKINPAAAGTEARIADMRATLARNLAFGKLDNGPLIAKIAAAQAKLDALRIKIARQIAAGKIDTDNWTNSIAKAQTKFNVWKISLGGKITVGNLVMPSPPASGFGGGGGPSAFGERSDIVKAAESRVGDPYVWGGSSPGGFDCSGLMYWAYQHSGDHDFPRIPTYGGKQISRGNIQPADIMFYYPGSVQNGVRVPFGHFKMYAGNNQTVESTSGGVQIRPADWGGVAQIRSYLARGGITTGPSIAGEAGPEAVIPLTNARRGAAVMREAGLLPGGESSSTINVNVVVPGGTTIIGTAQQVGDIIAPHVARALAVTAGGDHRVR